MRGTWRRGRPEAAAGVSPVLRRAATEGQGGAPLFVFERGREEESLGQEMARDRVEARGGDLVGFESKSSGSSSGWWEEEWEDPDVDSVECGGGVEGF